MRHAPRQQRHNVVRVGRIPAHDPVLFQQPHVAQLANCLFLHGRHRVRIGLAFRRGVERGQQFVDIAKVEPGQPDVVPAVHQLAQIQRQHLVVPSGVQRQFVVGDDVGAFLRVAQVPQAQAWHVGPSQLPRGQHAPVAGDDAALAIDQHRIGKAELLDAGRDLSHLSIRMRAAVAGVGD